jgi:hypothetical protein
MWEFLEYYVEKIIIANTLTVKCEQKNTESDIAQFMKYFSFLVIWRIERLKKFCVF